MGLISENWQEKLKKKKNLKFFSCNFSFFEDFKRKIVFSNTLTIWLKTRFPKNPFSQKFFRIEAIFFLKKKKGVPRELFTPLFPLVKKKKSGLSLKKLLVWGFNLKKRGIYSVNLRKISTG